MSATRRTRSPNREPSVPEPVPSRTYAPRETGRNTIRDASTLGPRAGVARSLVARGAAQCSCGAGHAPVRSGRGSCREPPPEPSLPWQGSTDERALVPRVRRRAHTDSRTRRSGDLRRGGRREAREQANRRARRLGSHGGATGTLHHHVSPMRRGRSVCSAPRLACDHRGADRQIAECASGVFAPFGGRGEREHTLGSVDPCHGSRTVQAAALGRTHKTPNAQARARLAVSIAQRRVRPARPSHAGAGDPGCDASRIVFRPVSRGAGNADSGPARGSQAHDSGSKVSALSRSYACTIRCTSGWRTTSFDVKNVKRDLRRRAGRRSLA